MTKLDLQQRLQQVEKERDSLQQQVNALAEDNATLRQQRAGLAREANAFEAEIASAQPQRFFVKLPEEYGTVFIGGAGVRVFSEPSVIEAIKAANGEIAD